MLQELLSLLENVSEADEAAWGTAEKLHEVAASLAGQQVVDTVNYSEVML
jgi:hypothetical protein